MATDLTNDLRPAIRERLRAVEIELADLPLRQKKLEALRDSLRAMLTHEDALHGEGEVVDESLVPAFHPTRDRRTLADLILQVLGTGPKTLEQLKELGTLWGPVKDSAFPGRAINFALVGLQKGGYVERLQNGSWKIVSAKAGVTPIHLQRWIGDSEDNAGITDHVWSIEELIDAALANTEPSDGRRRARPQLCVLNGGKA